MRTSGTCPLLLVDGTGWPCGMSPATATAGTAWRPGMLGKEEGRIRATCAAGKGGAVVAASTRGMGIRDPSSAQG